MWSVRKWLWTQKLGAIELTVFAGGHTDVDGQRKCMHMHYCVHVPSFYPLTLSPPQDQLSFPLLGTCVVHFRVITLDLLNHCFFRLYLVMTQRSEQRSIDGKKIHIRAKGEKEFRDKLPLSLSLSRHWLCIFQHFHSPAQLSAACEQVCVSLVCLWKQSNLIKKRLLT